MCKTDMCLAWVHSFSKLRQNITNLWNFKHAYPRHLGALQKNTKFTMIVVVVTKSYCLDFQNNQSRKICQMF